jgi:hypothetical protein
MNLDLQYQYSREPWAGERGDFLATGSSGGQGEAEIAVFAQPKGAEEAATEMASASEKPNGKGSVETPAGEGVKAASRDNVAWIAWTNGAHTSEQIASCVS